MAPPKHKVRAPQAPDRQAPSSPTEIPLPAAGAEPTSPALEDEEEQVGVIVPARKAPVAARKAFPDPSSPTEMPVPTLAGRAPALDAPSSPTELPVPTEMPAPTSPAPSSPGQPADEEQTVPALQKSKRLSTTALEPTSPADANMLPAAVPSPTSIGDENEEELSVPVPAARKKAVLQSPGSLPPPKVSVAAPPLDSSPTEIPVPTEMPAPTSPAAPSSPAGRFERRRGKRQGAAPSSPTELPIGKTVQAATSPADVPVDEDDELLPPKTAATAKGKPAPSSPTEMPVPTMAPSPTSAVDSDGEEVTAPGLRVPKRPVTELAVMSPTSIAPYDDGDDELVSVPAPRLRPPMTKKKGQPTSPTEIPQQYPGQEPTSPADDAEEAVLVPLKSARPPRAARGPGAPSSPTELPVPTLVPSPTSPAPDDDEEPPVPRQRIQEQQDRPPSPTYLPGAQHEPTSPADDDLADDQQLEVPTEMVPTEPMPTRSSNDPSSVPTEVATQPTVSSQRSQGVPTVEPSTRSASTQLPPSVPTEEMPEDSTLPAAKRRREQAGILSPTGVVSPSMAQSSIPTEFTNVPPTPSQPHTPAGSAVGTPSGRAEQPGTPSRRAWKGPPTPQGSATASPSGVVIGHPPTPSFSPTEEVFAPATPEDRIVGRALRAAAGRRSATPLRVAPGSAGGSAAESPTYIAQASGGLALPPTPTYSGSSPTYVEEVEPPTPTLMDDSAAYGDEEDATAVAYFGVLAGRRTGAPGTPTSVGAPDTPTAGGGTPRLKPSATAGGGPAMRLPGLESPTPTYDPDDETVFGEDASSVASWMGSAAATSGVSGPAGAAGGRTAPLGNLPLQPVTPRPWHGATPPGTPVPPTPGSAGPGTPSMQPGTPQPPSVPVGSAGVVYAPPAAGTPPAAPQAKGRGKRGAEDDEELPPWKRRERRRKQ